MHRRAKRGDRMSGFGLAAAEALLEIGRPAQAREHAAGYLAGHPEDARGLRLIARCYEATDDYGPMLETARAALEVDAQSYQGHVLLASALIHMRRYTEAVEVTTAAIRLHPYGWRGHLLAGVAQCALGLRRAGMAAVSRAVALAPHEPHTHYVQALLRHSAGNRLGAKRAYRRALGLAPGHAGAQRGLGHIALAAGRLVDAVGHFTGAAAAEPGAGGGGVEKALLGIAGWAVLTSLVLLLAFAASVAAVLGVDMVARPRAPGPDGAPEPPDAPLQHAAARLTWRVLRAACVPAGVLVFLSTGGAAWSVRAVVGTLLIGGDAAALVRVPRG